MLNNKGLTTKLHLFCIFSCSVVFYLFHGNSHNTPDGKKLIESIYFKNNNFLLMDRAYEDYETLILGKAQGFRT